MHERNALNSADPDDFCVQIDQIGCALADDRRLAACRQIGSCALCRPESATVWDAVWPGSAVRKVSASALRRGRLGGSGRALGGTSAEQGPGEPVPGIE
jgi:hypothetical protein